MPYWLFKSEPHAYGFEQLRADRTTPWSGVRNWQARGNMQAMAVGDLGFFYHSSIPQPCAVGSVKVVKTAYPDFTQFDPTSEYYDATSRPERPKWYMVDVEFVEPLPHPVTLARMRAEPRLEGMVLLRRGHLSVQPVTPREWAIVMELSQSPE
ncbi:MAG TPA: EVE domain-containing protein [Candidatus Tyrphobacter sp.]